MTRYAIGMGSNLGDRVEHLRSAVAELSRHGSDVRVSPIYETEPIGGVDQDPYLNAVAIGEFSLNPHGMLELINRIEADHGRDRSAEVRWGPRPLDLDLIATESQPVNSDRLTIPHPRAHEREFVVRPLVDVWPAAPIGGSDAASFLEDVAEQGVVRLATGWLEPPGRLRPWLFVAGQFLLIALIGVIAVATGDLRAPWDVWRALGVLLGVAGAAIAIDSARRIGPAMTALPVPTSDAVLVEGGAFSLVRHPIYLGVTLLMTGLSLGLASRAAALVSLVLVPYFIQKAKYEETRLRLVFPGYSAYARRVDRRLIPFVL